MKITMVGHSTVLIEINGMRVLTDPFFGLRGNLVYSRPDPPGMSRDSLRNVDLVLVSHNHFDHTDPEFFRLLPSGTPVIAPALSSWVTRLKGAANVTGIRPWQRRQFGDLVVTATPAWHSTVTHGFVIQSGDASVYFAADTYFGGFMRRIAAEFAPQVAIMPVTTFRLPLTMGERGALAAARVLRPQIIIPIHMGITPRNPFLRSRQTPECFAEKLALTGAQTKVVILREGEAWEGALAAGQSSAGSDKLLLRV